MPEVLSDDMSGARRYPFVALGLLTASILFFWIGKDVAHELIRKFPKGGEIIFYTAALFSLCVAYFSPTPNTKLFRLLAGGTGLILAAVAAPVFVGYPVANIDFAPLSQRLFLIGPTIVIIFGILAYWRPVLLIGCGFFPLVERALVQHISGLPISKLDIYPVYEVAIFLGVASAIFAIAHHVCGWMKTWQLGQHEERFFGLAWIFALGIHFGNYFYSGVQKIKIDGPLLSWVMHNETNSTALLSAWFNGRWMFSQFPEFTTSLVEYLSYTNVPTNIFVLCIQLAAPIAFLRLNWIKIQTVLYDIMHIAIFVIAGLFFWKWILLNFAFLLSARKFDSEKYDLTVKVVGICAVVLGFNVAQTAKLAWYDTEAVLARTFYAHTDDGREYRVPISYFLNQGYSVSHGRFYLDPSSHFPTSPEGNTRFFDVHQASLKCDFSDLPQAKAYRKSKEFTQTNEQTVRFVQAHHKLFNSLSDDGRFNYVLFPFHHLSNPADYDDFFALDKRRVTSYSLVTRSLCVYTQDGRLRTKVQHETRYEIPLN
ncbi:MAG: hypothetical protein AAGK17_12005 [Pseudomonadota bacterium]